MTGGAEGSQSQRTARLSPVAPPSTKSDASTHGAAAAAAEPVSDACPLSTLNAPREAAEGLDRCPEYEKSACCSPEEHESLDLAFRSAYEMLYRECPGCQENLRRLLCAVRCAPTQRDFTTTREAEAAPPSTLVRVCPGFGADFMASCANTTAAAIFGGSDPMGFTNAQLDVSAGLRVVESSAWCGRLAHSPKCELEARPPAPPVRFTKGQITVLALLGTCFFCGLYGIYKVCNPVKALRPQMFDPYKPYSRQPLFVPAEDLDAPLAEELGGAAVGDDSLTTATL